MARFTHNGVEYEELGDGKVRVIGPVANQPYTVTPIPLSPEQQAEEERKRRDQLLQEQAARDAAEERERKRREWIATHNPDGSPKVPEQKPPAGFRTTADGNLEYIPGGPADPALNGKALRQGDADKLRAAINQFADMARIRSNFQADFGGNIAGSIENWAQGLASGIGTPGQRDWWSDMAAMDNIIRNNLFGASLTEGEKAAYNRTTVTPGMDALEIEKNLSRRQDVMRGALQRYIAGLKAGGWNEGEINALVGDQAENLYPDRAKENAQRDPNAFNQVVITNDGPQAAGPGATQEEHPVPSAMREEHDAWIRNNLSAMTPDDYVSFRNYLDAKYNFGSDNDAALQWAQDAVKTRDSGRGTINTALPGQARPLEGFEATWNDIVTSAPGSFAASALNAGGWGVPSLLAGDRYEALRQLNPISTTLGEIAGGVTGTLVTGAGLRGATGLLASPTARNVVANPLTADITYGAAYGATQADDPLYGAVGGGLAGYAGNRVGNWIGRRVPGLFGLRGATDPLNAGERMVFDAADNAGIDDITVNLRRASELGVPANIADVAPEIHSLAGSAIRRSPEAAGAVRDNLAQRSMGQYDRLLGAIERDLGPITNIPQRSEELIQQARTAAGPLYDAAYAAPGASAVPLDDLMARPSMQQAIARARRIAAEEGRDPTTLGFDLSPEGEVVLTRVPSWQTLDYVKRGLDDVVEGYRDPVTNRLNLNTEGKAVNDTLRDLLSRIDEYNPDYAAARAAYAGPAQERSALTAGQGAATMRPDELAVAVASMTPERLAQARLGFQSQLAENAGRVRYSTNPFDSVLGTPNMEQRLGSLYGQTDEVARLLSQRDLERQVAGSTNRLIGNSATAERLAADQAWSQGGLATDVAQGALETAVTGAPVVTALRSGLGRRAVDAFKDRFGRDTVERANQVAEVALDTDTQAAINRILDMQRRNDAYQQIVEALSQQGAVRGGHALGGLGSVIAAEIMR